MRKLIFLVIAVAFWSATNAQLSAAYKASFAADKSKRIAELKSENGWVNLVGLYWLENGSNPFGNAKNNKVVFPSDFPYAKAGTMELAGGKVILHGGIPDLQVYSKGEKITDSILFDTADTKAAKEVKLGGFKWTIIQRQDKVGVRLRNLHSPKLESIKDIPSFPLAEKWIVPAKFLPAEEEELYTFQNKIGQNFKNRAIGKIAFDYEGKHYELEIMSASKHGYFIVFGDATSGNETYLAGRFLTVTSADAAGNTVIDFNKAVNPPCAFSDFATCPLPPSSNILPFAVTAGEKNIHLQ